MSDNNSRKHSIVEAIYSSLDSDNLEGAVRNCVRLARLSSDLTNLAFFMALQEYTPGEAPRNFLIDAAVIADDQAARNAWISGAERALRVRHLSESDRQMLGIKDKDRTLLYLGSNLIKKDIMNSTLRLETFAIPNGMTPHDTAVFHSESLNHRLTLIARKEVAEKIAARMASHCSDYASSTERQLVFDQAASNSLGAFTDEIGLYLRENIPDAFAQLSAASQNISKVDAESLSVSLTQIRRCLKSVADHVYPADPAIPALCEDKYLNRLSKFVEDRESHLGRGLPINADRLEALLKDIQDRASKGVHSFVSEFEARQTFLAFILYLGNIVELSRS